MSRQVSYYNSREELPAFSRTLALAAMHLGCLGVIWVGWSAAAVSIAFALYVVRAFGLTAFYHRYFSHRAFKTSRPMHFIGGLLGCLALQKGPLWWAAHHREHHRSSDHDGDVHSPHVHSVLWAHMGWFLTPQNNEVRQWLIRDWLKFPELRWLDRSAPVIAVAYGLTLFATGEFLGRSFPETRASGAQLFVWGYFVSTVCLYHATYSVNSIAHLFGSRRYQTRDQSRNNWLVALLTLGEGWHNNHHHYPAAARQGFFWWEFDVTYYVLLLLERLGLVWGLRRVPQSVLQAAAPLSDLKQSVDREPISCVN